jgi:predicted nicotinamide N-methyase
MRSGEDVGVRYPNARVAGRLWGRDCEPILRLNGGRFDLVVLSDAIFNHAAHRQLLRSVAALMGGAGRALALFTHHRAPRGRGPALLRDRAVRHPPMFADAGDIELRTTAHVRVMTWKGA